MKLKCTVELHDKELGYRTKWQRSVLSLEKKVDSYKIEAYLVWETKENGPVKYLISRKDLYHFSNNLEQTKCSNYSNLKILHIYYFGTIHFKIPNYTLLIKKTDGASLESFINLVSLLSFGRWYFYEKFLRSIFKKEITHQVNIRLKKKDYPPKEGFPKTTEGLFKKEIIHQVDIRLKKKDYPPKEGFSRTERLFLYDLNITELYAQLITLNLQSLKSLNISDNKILSLPKELGILPHLEELSLSYNCLGNYLENAKWEWMEQTAISQSLKWLYINNNNLTEFPSQIEKLQSLIFLDVSDNLLTKVPQIIGTLQQLTVLNVSKNRLTYLPGSMRGMELYRLLTASNSFRDLYTDEYRSLTLNVVSLLDLAAKAVKKYRLPYNNLPSTWVRYLKNCKYCCICRNPCFHSDIKIFKPLLDRPTRPINGNLVSDVCQNFDIPTDRRILFKCYFCSLECYFYFCKTH